MAEQHLRKNIEAISSSRNKLKKPLENVPSFSYNKTVTSVWRGRNVRFKSVSAQRLTLNCRVEAATENAEK